MLSSYQAQIIEQRQLYGIEAPKENLEDFIKKVREETVKLYAHYDRYRIAIQGEDRNWHIKTFKRHKITTVDFAKAKEISHELNSNEDEIIEPIELEEEEEEESDDNNDDIDNKQLEQVLQYYRFLAGCYLKMTEQEFNNCDWGKLRLVIDACQYRTTHSFATDSEGLFEFFHLEDSRGNAFTKKLTDRDYQALKMFRLWIGKAKIKPWQTNGGIIYEEDINTFLKLEELQISGDKLKAKKKQAREDGKAGASIGPDGVLHRKTTKFRNR